MATYLLTWNPNKTSWDDLSNLSDMVKGGSTETFDWSCGRTKRIQEGDRVFLLRQAKEPKGIFASGTVVRGSYEDVHWANVGETAWYVGAEYDVLLDPDRDKILLREQLDKFPFKKAHVKKVHWNTQSSGISIPDEIATEIEKALAKLEDTVNFKLAEELSDAEILYEGAKRKISINTYERNPKARKKCIDYYGFICSVCNFDFVKKYGSVGKDFIHVHHLKPVSEITSKYQIDPINDLRPVCPNCHAIIHRNTPPYTIKEVKEFIQEAEGE